MGEPLLTMPEAADRLRMPEATLRYWRHKGVGPRSFKIGRRVMYEAGEVERFIKAQIGESDAL